ncbi:hypothetical protein ACROYT_G006247 [Oculina patagonica]
MSQNTEEIDNAGCKSVQFQMAVLQSNRERKLKLQDLNSFITCELCRGYLIKPTTITECLHTFCRSCVVKYLQDSDDNNCPSCSILIHETNPFDMLRSDQTLEDVIYKLVPKLQEISINSDNSVQEQPVRELVRKYIRCSSRLTIGQVKKFLKVEVMCNGEIMGKDHTLEFVYMTRWRVKEGTVLTLQYRPRMDFL